MRTGVREFVSRESLPFTASPAAASPAAGTLTVAAVPSPRFDRAVLALTRSERLLAFCAAPVTRESLPFTTSPAAASPAAGTLTVAAVPSPRFDRAVIALARSERLLAFCAAPVIRESLPCAAVPAVVPYATSTWTFAPLGFDAVVPVPLCRFRDRLRRVVHIVRLEGDREPPMLDPQGEPASPTCCTSIHTVQSPGTGTPEIAA
jgi:hypothetical protein